MPTHLATEFTDKLLRLPPEQRERLFIVGMGQPPFQWNYSVGKILNLACGTDMAALWTRGSVNIDLHAIEMNLGVQQAVDIVGDVRHVPIKDGTFDTAVLGEILEHFNSEDVPDVLREAARCLRPGGRIVATVPEDDREKTTDAMYAPGVSVQHHLVTPAMICDWCKSAELDLQVLNRIDYGFCTGYGMVATRSKDKVQPITVFPKQ